MGKSSSKLSAESFERLKSNSKRHQNNHDVVPLETQLDNVLDDNVSLVNFLTNIFYQEVQVSDSMQTLFRGNCMASKVMSHCFRAFGSDYLRRMLEPHIKPLVDNISYEIDTTRLEEDGNIDENQKNLLKLTRQILESILSSANEFPEQLNLMCICLRKILGEKYPNSSTYLRAIGTVIFLRYINPAIVAPYEAGIVNAQPPPKTMRGLMLVSKILQNIANDVEFSKEEHMLPFNDFVRTQFDPMRKWVSEISSERPGSIKLKLQ